MSQPPITVLFVPPFSLLCNAAFALRREVFIAEQKVPEPEEFDADDLAATHFVAIVGGEVVGTLRLTRGEDHVKIGRVAVKASSRGQGIARAMMLEAMAHARALGQDRFALSAQSDKLGFHEKLGFVAYGPEFQDTGMPHRAMRTY